MITANQEKSQITLSEDGQIISITIPITIKRKGGRKMVITPDNGLGVESETDDTLINALIKGYYWIRKIEAGKPRTIKELAEKEKVNASYMSRIIRLTTLAPDIQESILEGSQPRDLLLADLMSPFSVDWRE